MNRCGRVALHDACGTIRTVSNRAQEDTQYHCVDPCRHAPRLRSTQRRSPTTWTSTASCRRYKSSFLERLSRLSGTLTLAAARIVRYALDVRISLVRPSRSSAPVRSARPVTTMGIHDVTGTKDGHSRSCHSATVAVVDLMQVGQSRRLYHRRPSAERTRRLLRSTDNKQVFAWAASRLSGRCCFSL